MGAGVGDGVGGATHWKIGIPLRYPTIVQIGGGGGTSKTCLGEETCALGVFALPSIAGVRFAFPPLHAARETAAERATAAIAK